MYRIRGRKWNKFLLKGTILIIMSMIGVCALPSCKSTSHEKVESAEFSIHPASDPQNLEGWILNEEISDEFEGIELDTNKWFIEGQNGDYYIWKGRPPSQFVPHNVILEDGKLKLRTQWEPDFDFVKENYSDGNNNDPYGIYEGKSLPITTAGVITKKRFLNGYMEVKSKAGNAAITAAFWAIGHEQELDIFEQMGNPKTEKGDIWDTGSKSTIHDWSPPAQRPTWAWRYKDNQLPFRVADDFHIYGAEWGEDYLKIYIDGKLVSEVTQDELGTDWVLNNPMEIWLDSEIFKWLGVPHEAELPVDFEIEYMRVWQKSNDNLLAKQFYGFEGPILFEDHPRPLTLLPESSVPDDYQKFWLIDSASSKYFSIVTGYYASGVNSLEFAGFGKNEKLEAEKVVAVSPKGAIDIPVGEYSLSFKIWLDQGRAVRKLYFSFEDPHEEIMIDLEELNLNRRKWVKIKKTFSKSQGSSSSDQFKIEIRKEDVPEIKAAKLFIDDIKISKKYKHVQ